MDVKNWLENYHDIITRINIDSRLGINTERVQQLTMENKLLKCAIENLPYPEREVIRSHYIDNVAYSKIGKKINYCKTGVYRIGQKGIDILDKVLNEEKILPLN